MSSQVNTKEQGHSSLFQRSSFSPAPTKHTLPSDNASVKCLRENNLSNIGPMLGAAGMMATNYMTGQVIKKGTDILSNWTNRIKEKDTNTTKTNDFLSVLKSIGLWMQSSEPNELLSAGQLKLLLERLPLYVQIAFAPLNVDKKRSALMSLYSFYSQQNRQQQQNLEETAKKKYDELYDALNDDLEDLPDKEKHDEVLVYCNNKNTEDTRLLKEYLQEYMEHLHASANKPATYLEHKHIGLDLVSCINQIVNGTQLKKRALWYDKERFKNELDFAQKDIETRKKVKGITPTKTKRTKKKPNFDDFLDKRVSGQELYTIFKSQQQHQEEDYWNQLSKKDRFQLARDWFSATMEPMIGVNAGFQRQINEIISYHQKVGHRSFPRTWHAVFRGQPGTGKSTFAQIYARVLYKCGAVANNKYVMKTSNELVKPSGSTAEKATSLIQSFNGGVFALDEAYNLNNFNQPGNKELFDTLMNSIQGTNVDSDKNAYTTFLFLGYEKEMNDFLEANPGFQRRMNYTFSFRSYTLQELTQMFLVRFKHTFATSKDILPFQKLGTQDKGLVFDEFQKVPKHILEDYNAGAIKEIINWVLLELRDCNHTIDKCMSTHIETYVQNGFKRFVENLKCGQTCESITDRNAFKKKIQELFQEEGFVDQDDYILKKLLEIFDSRQINEQWKGWRGQQVSNFDPKVSLTNQYHHTAILGSPGTGKTTLANIWGKALCQMGALSNTKSTKVTSKDLIKEYVGASGVYTRDLIKDNLGGMLCIDEAYNLAPKGDETADTYAAEVRNAIMDSMDGTATYQDPSQYTTFTFMGYANEMTAFFNSNPGFRRRVNHLLIIPSFSGEQLANLLKQKFERQGFHIDEIQSIANAIKKRDDFQTHIQTELNAQFVSMIHDEIIRRHFKSKTINPNIPSQLILEVCSQWNIVSTVNTDHHKHTGQQADSAKKGNVLQPRKDADYHCSVIRGKDGTYKAHCVKN